MYCHAGDNEVTHQVLASVGIALFPRDAQDSEGLLKMADQAMYEAKEAGKARCYFYAPEA